MFWLKKTARACIFPHMAMCNVGIVFISEISRALEAKLRNIVTETEHTKNFVLKNWVGNKPSTFLIKNVF